MIARSDLHRVGIIGGSLGGLFHAVGLQRFGVDVDIWERSAGRPDDRGAGIVLQPGVAWFLRTLCDVDPDAVTVAVTHRQYFARDGQAQLGAMGQQMISWGTIYNSLRDTLAPTSYHGGQAVTGVEGHDAGATVFTDTGIHQVDLAIIADGSNSRHRGLVDAGGTPIYAGYIAYRGVVDEAQLPEHLAAEFSGRFSFYDGPQSQFLCYFIPGANGSVAPGERRLNWVWYVSADAERLCEVTTDVTGHTHGTSVPPGLIAPTIRAQLLDLATATLPEVIAQLVEHTAEPFAQAILDAAVTTMRSGRLLLSGDAAFVVRPHTAASAEKAAGDAMALLSALGQDSTLEDALAGWERDRLQEGSAIYHHGIGLGSRLGLASPTASIEP